MQFSWLIKNNSNKLIVFFNGWSLDENIVKNLDSTGFDVLMFNDYSDLNIEEKLLNETNNYSEVNVIAWSFGVWASSYVVDKIKNLKSATAINGTLCAIDENYGIPKRIFDLTLSNFSEKNYLKFFKNMFDVFEYDYQKMLPERESENQKNELMQIQKQSFENKKLDNAKFFSRVIIGNSDKIIPTKNQLNFWRDKFTARIIQVEKGHFVFDLFSSWDEILTR